MMTIRSFFHDGNERMIRQLLGHFFEIIMIGHVAKLVFYDGFDMTI
jgi:hypothetical protein